MSDVSESLLCAACRVGRTRRRQERSASRGLQVDEYGHIEDRD